MQTLTTLSRSGALVLFIACVASCDADSNHPPSCDSFNAALGVEPDLELPATDFRVRCVDGSWAATLDAQPATSTEALAVAPRGEVLLHPDGGYIVRIWTDADDLDAGWGPALAEAGLPTTTETIWLDADLATIRWGSSATHVVVDDGGDLWAIDRHNGAPRLVVLDAATGSTVDSSVWETPEPSQMVAARGAGGVWITSGDPSDKDVQTTRRLHRAPGLEGAIELIAELQGPGMDFPADDELSALSDGGAAWALRDGRVLVFGGDSTPRWEWESGSPGLPIVGEGQGEVVLVAHGAPMHLAGLALADGGELWTKTYQRYDFAEDELCDGSPGCFVSDSASSILARPGGGWYVVGTDTWPSDVCGVQPLVLALDAGGAGIWGHRVDVCGLASGVGIVGEQLVILGRSLEGHTSVGSWLRWI